MLSFLSRVLTKRASSSKSASFIVAHLAFRPPFAHVTNAPHTENASVANPPSLDASGGLALSRQTPDGVVRDTRPFAEISHRLACGNLRAVSASASHPSSTVQHDRCASRQFDVASLVPASHDAASLILAPRDVASHITALHDVASRIPASRDATLHIPALHDIAVTILEFFRHILP